MDWSRLSPKTLAILSLIFFGAEVAKNNKFVLNYTKCTQEKAA